MSMTKRENGTTTLKGQNIVIKKIGTLCHTFLEEREAERVN